MNFQELAKKYGTPLYAYDFDHIKNQYETLKQSFFGAKSLVCYAMKANSNLSLLSFLASLGAGFDCVSFNEVKKAFLAGAKKYQIILSGVGKRDDELSDALDSDILMINIESEAELYRLEQIAKNKDKIARISIRVNPNVDAKTHPYISTGLKDNKFGVDINTARKMYIYAKKSSYILPIGIHFHIGSQLCSVKPIVEAAKIVSCLVKELKAIDIDIKFFDVGGGIGIKYNDEETINLKEYADGIISCLRDLDLSIICEMGRFLVGNSGYFISKVLYEKENEGKRFVIIDGAMNDLIRPSLYGAYHKIFYFNKSKETSICDVVGPVCESGDFLAKNINLPKFDSGDVIVFESAGAYGFAMSSNYNSRLKPAEIAFDKNGDRLIRKRQSFEDLISLEKI